MQFEIPDPFPGRLNWVVGDFFRRRGVPMMSQPQLDSWLGKSMTDICLNGYDNTSHNHCAHFVSHVLNLHFGYTCRAHVRGQHPGANLRVQEIFARCPGTHEILQCTPDLAGLIFVSHKSNFVTRNGTTTLNNVPRKHIAIIHGGFVWHYSNTRNRVVKQPMSEFLNHYPGQDNALWFGSLPAGARAISFGQC